MPDDKAKWLAGLKVGDPVVVGDRHGAGTLTTITRRVPTRINTDAGLDFDPDTGYPIGRDLCYGLLEPTTEQRQAIKQEWLANELHYRTTWCRLPLATLEAVSELVTQSGRAGR